MSPVRSYVKAGFAIVTVVVACKGKDKSSGDTKSVTVASAGVPKTQLEKLPCDWISRADAQKAMGDSVIGDPVRVRSAENPVPQSNGEGCLYPLKPAAGMDESHVAVQVTIDDAGVMQAGFSGVPDIQAVFGGKESHGDSVVSGRWDYESGLPGGISMKRKGRLVIMTNGYGKSDQGDSLAGAVLDRIPDLPFTRDAADPNAKSEDPNPCSLITRAEAEKVLGPLAIAPYRSRGQSAIAHGNGSSCTYYQGKHRAFIVTPDFSDGAMKYKMGAGVGNMVSGVLGGAKAPDTLDGPWDQLSTSFTGALTFLKGDKMVEMEFKSSTADFTKAVALARIAAARL